MTLANHRTPRTACPACDRNLDGALAALPDDRAPPNLGDAAICIGCGSINIFDANLALRAASPEELLSMMTDKEFSRHCLRVRAKVDMVRKARP